MRSKIYNPLSPELLKMLKIIAHADLAALGTIAQHAGSNTQGLLKTLRKRGYVSEHAGRQSNGGPTTMYSVSVKGKNAIKESEGESARGIEPIPVSVATADTPPREVYRGNEMRPYAGRPGAMDAFRFPSRIGNQLHHRDGSVTSIVSP